jgi:hypothetical protein
MHLCGVGQFVGLGECAFICAWSQALRLLFRRTSLKMDSIERFLIGTFSRYNRTFHLHSRPPLNKTGDQVENLYSKGVRSFLFVNVPPIDRAPLFIEQGTAATRAVKASLADYNAQLSGQVRAFQARHKDLDQITVFDSNAIFNTLLDNAATLGFVNSTGFCDAYQVSWSVDWQFLGI